jgi:branched-chain amino acid transport system substrate-binding protein
LRQKLVRIVGGVALVALVAGGAAACKKDDNTTGTGASCAVSGLKIGFFGALSGDNAGLITPSRNGAQMALEKYNAAHPGCTVAIQDYDSQGSADKAPALANGAVNDSKIIGVVGPGFSGESEVALPIFTKAGLPTITQSATRDDLSTQGWTVFHRGVGHDSSQGPAGGRYIVNIAGAKKVYLVQDDSAYGKGLADNAKTVLQPSMVGSDKVNTGDRKFDAVVNKIKQSGADAVYYGGYTAEASPFLKQLRAAGYKGLFVGGDGIYDDNMLSATGKSDVEGTIATCPCAPATQAGGTFPADYKKEFNVDAGAYADVGYDVMNIFLEGIAAGKTTRADMLAFINGYNKKGAVSGVTYSWPAADNGELDPAQVRIWAYQATNGVWTPKIEIPKTS